MSFPSTIYALCRSDHFFAKFVRGSAECVAAQRRFTESLAAYSIITYLLQVCVGGKCGGREVCGGSAPLHGEPGRVLHHHVPAAGGGGGEEGGRKCVCGGSVRVTQCRFRYVLMKYAASISLAAYSISTYLLQVGRGGGSWRDAGVGGMGGGMR